MSSKIRKTTGFSIPELMVVVVIIGILTALALPRMRAFIARSRQAEAKNLLAQIHTLQHTYQNLKDTYARWGSGDRIGKDGDCALTGTAAHGPEKLGFKPANCEDLRYGYWIIQGVKDGVEGYLAVAYAPSDDEDRIYPTCTGEGNSRTVSMTHPFGNTNIASQAGADGDWQTLTENKKWEHDDIVEVCD